MSSILNQRPDVVSLLIDYLSFRGVCEKWTDIYFSEDVRQLDTQR